MFAKIARIFKWTMGILAMLMLLVLFSVFYFPPTQKWIADKTAEALSEYFHTRVTLDILAPSLPHHLMAENLCVYDQQGDTLMAVAHCDVTLQLLPLLHNEIIINNAQLFGYDIHLVKPDSVHSGNYQFLVDAFKSNKSDSKPLNLEIQNLKIRNGNIYYDQLDIPRTASFSPAHLHLHDLTLKAQTSIKDGNILNVDIQELKLTSLNDNFKIENLLVKASADLKKQQYQLRHLNLKLPRSLLTLHGKYKDGELDIHSQAKTLCLSDFSLFCPLLEKFSQPQTISFAAHANKSAFAVDTFQVQSPLYLLVAEADGSFDTEQTQQFMPKSAALHLDELSIFPGFIEEYLPIFTDSSKIINLASNIGNLSMRGNVQYEPTSISADLDALTDVGNITLQGEKQVNDNFQAQLQAKQVNLSKIFPAVLPFSIENLNADLDFAGNLQHGIQQIEADISDATSDCRFKMDAFITAANHISFTTEGLEQLEATLHIDTIYLPRPSTSIRLNDIDVSISNTDEGHHIMLNSDFAEVDLQGHFKYLQMPQIVQRALHHSIPSLFPATAANNGIENNELHLNATLSQTPLIHTALGLNLDLLEPLHLQADIVPQKSLFEFQAQLPAFNYNGQKLRNLVLNATQEDQALQLQLNVLHSNITLQDSLNVLLKAIAANDKIHTDIYWNTLTPRGYDGQLSAASSFQRDSLQALVAKTQILPTTIFFAGKPWNMHAANIWHNTKGYTFQNIKLSNGNKHLCINGNMANKEEDSLIVNVQNIQIENILQLAKFQTLDIAGNVNGDIAVSQFKSKPQIGSNLVIKNLHINNGKMGDFIVDFGFGRKTSKSIDFIGEITEPMRGEVSGIDGFIDLGEKKLDLKVDAHNLNIDFLNKFTKNFFRNLHARTTGLCNIYGTFRDIDLQGDMQLDTFAVNMDVCGARYHALPGDSILLRSGEIEIRHVHILDDLAGTDNRLHAGEVNGLVTHTKLRRFFYDIDVKTNDILSFNKPNAGEFSGRIFTEGNIHVSGTPNNLEVNINASPTKGSTIVYDLTTPEATTNNEFIHFIDKDAQNTTALVQDSSPSTKKIYVVPNREDERVNININANPNLALKFKMGSNNSDNITLYGDGMLHAHFFNKGTFQLYGTYHVNNGTYQLSLQDIIRKDFQFQKGGTLVFGGDPNKATLNLQALHTVSGVSLNDLTAASNFTKTKVRVNCLLNIQGTAEQPQLTFDFDIPNVNDDEKQMVRTMISTDEERNTQVLYLLGLGRFYPFDTGTQTNQTNTAMQGLLSSTLSGQLNNILTSAIGNSNWNFGTTFSTGTLGWQDMDVEGMLSGRLFNNRLLLNGTFGYRNTPIKNSNFIGDFEVQWFFTKSGHVSLKAYSETNDRYFTKSSLTTQGVGIQVQKDFTNLRDLFGIKQKKR